MAAGGDTPLKYSAHKLGAVFYVLWGILHMLSGTNFLYQLSTVGVTGLFAVPDSPQSFPEAAIALLTQHSWNLVIAGFFALAVGIWLNWRNSRIGYWLNLYLVGAFDVAFIFTRVLPGHTDASGWLGPILAVLAIVFTSIGLFREAAQTA